MTNTLWKNPVDGDWTTATDWKGGLPKASKDAVINANGTYTVSLASVGTAHSLTVDAAGATFSEAAGGSLTLADGLVLDAGTIILDAANNFGGQTRIFGGTLELGNAAALGNSGLTIAGGAVIGTANATFANAISANGSFTLAAGHGDTFKLTGQTLLNMNSGGNITFGQTGDDGVFVWNPLTLGVANDGTGFSVEINAGTLRDGNGSLNEVLSAAQSVDIAATSKLDIHGHAETINQLNGGGIINSSVHGGALTIGDGDFSGAIRGALSLAVDGALTLSGPLAYTGGTTINTGATLILPTLAHFPGNIVDNGSLDFSNPGPDPLVMDGGISGTGSVIYGAYDIILNGANTYTGGTKLSGTAEIGNAAAFGTGGVTIAGIGELVGTATETLSNQLTINGLATFLATDGTTLTLNGGTAGWAIGSNSNLVFGDATHDGVVVWDSPAGSTDNFAYGISVDGGTLRVGDDNFQSLLNSAIDIGPDGTLDVGGFANTFYGLRGTGTIANSGASTVITIEAAIFSGKITGPITLDIAEATSLSGDAANYSNIDLLPAAHLYLQGASSSNIVFLPGQSAQLEFDDPSQFSGSVAGFSSPDEMILPALGQHGISVSYSGDATGGTLTVSSSLGSAHIHMIGDYTGGTFYVGKVGNIKAVLFSPNPLAVTAHTDAFDFSSAAAPHVAGEAGVTHLHGGHAANEIVFAHDVTEALHAHGLMLDHFVHSLFAHGHAIPEALA